MTDDYSKKIEQYFNKELNEAEQTAFEQELTADSNFAKAFAQRKQMEDFLAVRPGREKLKAEVADLADSFFSEDVKPEAKRIPLRSRLYWISGAAAAAILLLLFLPRWLSTDPTYSQFAEHRPLSLQERGEDQKEIVAIETAFNNEEYATALTLLESYLQEEPTDLQAQIYASIAALEEGQPTLAIKRLGAIAQGQSAYRSTAHWYLALAHLQQKNYKSCRNSLQNIPESDFWHTRAVQLLKKLPQE